MIQQIDINRIKGRLTKVLIGFLALWYFFHLKTYERPDVIRHDMLSYYGYLPALLIHHDLSLQSIPEEEKEHYTWISPSEKHPVFRMTMGVALMNLPAFLMGHGMSVIQSQPLTGFNSTYYFFLLLSALFFFYRGLLIVFNICNRYTGFLASILCTLGIGFGTNLFYYSFDEALMSHVYSFFLYALLIKSTLDWHDTPKSRYALAIGFALGMLVLIRPIHAIAVFIPILYRCNLTKWQTVFRNPMQILYMILIGLACILPQLIYWKYASGHWVFYSYEEEGFFFSQPMLLKGLLGFRKGWLIYTPIMIVAIGGMFLWWKKLPEFRWVMLLIPVYLWIVFSWWCWWYGGSFGSRPMIDIYPLLAIPLALCIENLRRFTRSRFVFPVALVFLFIYLNQFQTQQYRMTLLHWDGMNAQLYEEIWMTKQFPKNYDELVKSPDYAAAVKGDRNQ